MHSQNSQIPLSTTTNHEKTSNLRKPTLSSKLNVNDNKAAALFSKNANVLDNNMSSRGSSGGSGSSNKSGLEKKGILRNAGGGGRCAKSKNVCFPAEVVKVIGYGGGPAGGSDDDEDETPTDPLDNASVAEVMQKNANTAEEKELHQLTQKNTNFNSIKTNLLGTTRIEIGPIVGCTGGKSMKGSYKPLVSIGTFETRKDAPKIQKGQGGGAPSTTDLGSNEKTLSHNKQLKTATDEHDGPAIKQKSKFSSSSTTKSASETSNNLLACSTSVTEISNEMSSTHIKAASKSSTSSSTSATTTTTNAEKVSGNSKTSPSSNIGSKTSNIGKTLNVISSSEVPLPKLSNEDSNHGLKNTFEVRPDRNATATAATSNGKKSAKETFSAASANNNNNNSRKSNLMTNHTTSSSAVLSSNSNSSSSSSLISTDAVRWGGGSRVTVGAVAYNNNNNKSNCPTTVDNSATVLKKIQKINLTSAEETTDLHSPSKTSSPIITATCTINTTGVVQAINNNSISKVIEPANKSQNKLIQVCHTKASEGSTAAAAADYNQNKSSSSSNSPSKTRSFNYQDVPVLVDSSGMETMAKNDQIGSEVNEPLHHHHRDKKELKYKISSNDSNSNLVSVMKSRLEMSNNNLNNKDLLSHRSSSQFISNRNHGSSNDHSSEFNDSLEDSGLDIKKCMEVSESDEKSGSGSDSGNEKDYNEQNDCNDANFYTTGAKLGLYVSVQDTSPTPKKQEKLSPDSVLFSSASEMSATGSSDSLPDAVVNDSREVQKIFAVGPGNECTVASTSVIIKRAAPRPPSCADNALVSSVKVDGGSHTSYAKAQHARKQRKCSFEVGELNGESTYKDPLHLVFVTGGESKKDEFGESNFEDDCNAVTVKVGGSKAGSGKSASASYSFQHSPTKSDADDDGKVLNRRSDGIEFIGIRKIDSEMFLRERSPTPEKFSDQEKQERSSSASPKSVRKVNQFFSTIGKRAGAAFSQHMHNYTKNRSSSVIKRASDIEEERSFPGYDNSVYNKRSMSTGEVSATRTQEIYATLTPTSLKLRGLAPVLSKLSKLDLTFGDKDKDKSNDLEHDSMEKGYKKHKVANSIRKMFRFASRDGVDKSVFKINEFEPTRDTSASANGSSPLSSPLCILDQPDNNTNFLISGKTTPLNHGIAAATTKKAPFTTAGTVSGRPPPPPPPRLHSLDLFKRFGVEGHSGVGTVAASTSRPSRPPPPTAKHNRVSPSFTAVFQNSNTNGTKDETNDLLKANKEDMPYTFDLNDPPSKPKRKTNNNNSNANSGDSKEINKDLETTYNEITNLNVETLKLIAGETPTRIQGTIKGLNVIVQLKWTHFDITEPSKPLLKGEGFVFYTASFNQTPCVLLIQESGTVPKAAAPFKFSCVETLATFQDSIPKCFITWRALQFPTNGSNIKVFVSVMPNCSMYTVNDYMHNSRVPLLHKYFALLQTIDYWDNVNFTELVVLVQNMEDCDGSSSTTTELLNSDLPISTQSSALVCVHPVPSASPSISETLSPNTHIISYNFEKALMQILICTTSSKQLSSSSSSSTDELVTYAPQLLRDNDRRVLLKHLNKKQSPMTSKEIFKLFMQVKLFTPKPDSEELERIIKLRSHRAVQQWLDKERALCMKEAVEQTLQSKVKSSISPFKKFYLEFLLISDSSAKVVLDMLIDLLE